MAAPRAHRGKEAAPAASKGGSMQSPPTKSVPKRAHGIGMSGSRPPMSGGGPRRAGFGLGFSMAGRGAPMSLGPATVVNSAEVPHFELREDPYFWMDNNVQVVIRVRPLNNNEKNLHSYNRCLKQESAQTITWTGQPETPFTFDHVAFETVDQEVLFRVAGLPMVQNCMAGYNSCVFAYGQTGSGKTYTMLGEISDLEVRPSSGRGMTPRIFEFLFARIKAEEESRRDEKLKYSCKCSFLEVYNEQIIDLLDPSSTNLPLREDIRNGVYVENLAEFEVGCVNDIIKLLMLGSANRKVAATNMNHESSRSHSVFTCNIESRWGKDLACNLRFARLNLVDLAGSERQKTSGAEGERLKEAVNINKSLSTLGLVIMSLGDLANGKQRHIPYRDSRLTFLLQDSLGGNSKTMIIANVSPSVCSANETLSTLKFAQRARRLIQNNAVVNENASGDVLALQHQIRLFKLTKSPRELNESRSVAKDQAVELAKLRRELNESRSVAKDQAVELANLRKVKKSLEQELASKSLELDDVVSDRQQLEVRILKCNENVSALEEELGKKFDELNVVSMENAELKSQLHHIEETSCTMEELADKIEVIGRLEKELIEMRTLINERNACLQSLQNDFLKLSDEKASCDTELLILNDKLEMAQAPAEESEAIATESRQIAEDDVVDTVGEDDVVEEPKSAGYMLVLFAHLSDQQKIKVEEKVKHIQS